MTRRASWIDLGQVFARHTQHAAGAGGGIIDGADHAGLGQGPSSSMKRRLTLRRMTSRGVKCSPGRFVRQLGEFANEFLEHGAHLRVASDPGMEVDVGELLGDEVEQPGLVEPVDLGVELERSKMSRTAGEKACR
jgi:hypothetical protein